MRKDLVQVQVMAVRPRRVVTIATYKSLSLARECRSGLEALGFEAILTYKAENIGD